LGARFRAAGREDQGEAVPTNYVKVWAHGFGQQEGKTKGRECLVVLVAGEGGGWRSRTTATAGPVVGEWGVARMLRVMEEDKAE